GGRFDHHPGQVGVLLLSPTHVQQFVPSIATGSVATMVTMAGRFVCGGGGGSIFIFTASDRVTALLLSVATAVRTCKPTGALLQTNCQRSEYVGVPGKF